MTGFYMMESLVVVDGLIHPPQRKSNVREIEELKTSSTTAVDPPGNYMLKVNNRNTRTRC